jgi:hypothetical protein
MNQIDDENTKTVMQSQFKNESKFTRLINNLDQKDRTLNPEKRKRKWFLVLAGLFLLYLISFLFPAPKLSHGSIQTTVTPDTVLDKTLKDQEPLTFEMPVDSFENVLKKHLHEELPQKK